jgi:phosphopantothenate---cysteine ligase (CTP)
VDEVRRITNFSTAEPGVLLSEEFAGAGFKTICLRGVAATHSATPAGAELHSFTTNADLADRLREFGASCSIAAVFHAAALCDYRVKGVQVVERPAERKLPAVMVRLGKARHQMIENSTDACIVNGRAYGSGFGFVHRSGELDQIVDKPELCAYLVSWLRICRSKNPVRFPTGGRRMAHGYHAST